MIRMSETAGTVERQAKEEVGMYGSETKVFATTAIVRIHMTFG